MKDQPVNEPSWNEISRRQAVVMAITAATGLALSESLFAPPASASTEPKWWHPFPSWAVLTTTFYEESGYWFPYPGRHRAVDYDPLTGEGTSCYAVASGTVQQAGWSSITGLGNTVQINHGGGYVSLYGHLKNPLVAVGQQVFGGNTVIGEMGKTGGNYHPHLHVEIWTGNSRSGRVDPLVRIGQGHAPLALSGSGQQTEEDDMAIIRIRDTTTGSIAMACVGGGLFWELPNTDYEALLNGWGLWDRTKDMNVPNNIYLFLKVVAQSARDVPAGVNTANLQAALDAELATSKLQ